MLLTLNHLFIALRCIFLSVQICHIFMP